MNLLEVTCAAFLALTESYYKTNNTRKPYTCNFRIISLFRLFYAIKIEKTQLTWDVVSIAHRSLWSVQSSCAPQRGRRGVVVACQTQECASPVWVSATLLLCHNRTLGLTVVNGSTLSSPWVKKVLYKPGNLNLFNLLFMNRDGAESVKIRA